MTESSPMRCPRCGHENASSSRSCLNYGLSLVRECAGCGKSLRRSARFCDNCGTPFPSTEEATLTADDLPAEPAPRLPVMFKGGRYMVKSFLGEGAGKKVYLVHDTLIDRDVAFALIKTEGLDDVGRRRVLREAQTMGRLTEHQNIVQIHDFGDENGQPFMVVSVMTGGSVEDLMSDSGGTLDADTVVRVAKDVCRGLAFAHGRDVIHRDLKPGNVWMMEDGTAKIGDFGIAVLVGEERMTREGMMVGTVSYMPPEFASGGEVDGRSDLYSLGCMLYAMIAGRPPFRAENALATVSQHINAKVVPPASYNPHCPEALEELILRLLAKEPADRPKSASDVLLQLDAIDTTHPEERIGDALVEAGLATAEEMERVRVESRSRGDCLLEALVTLGVVSRETVASVQSSAFRVPLVDVEAVQSSADVLRLVPREVALENRVLPIEIRPDGRCRVAITDFHPDSELAARLRSVTGRPVEFALVINDGELDGPIQRAYGSTPDTAGV